MNIALDFGNTINKIGFFENDTLVEVKSETDWQEISKVVNKLEQPSIIISSVSSNPLDFLKSLNPEFKVTVLNSATPVPFHKEYKSLDTLGTDRIAAVAGAILNYPNANVLVVDIGTCITYDIISSEGKYRGGGISPGFSIRFKSLNYYTKNLPLLKLEDNEINLIGSDTNSSILSGVINGTLQEIEGFIRLYQSKFRTLQVILTGGDSEFLKTRLNTETHWQPNLVLEGLNRILRYNEQNLE